jgi:uncharacterized membrane protein
MDILQLFEENFRFFASVVALLIEGAVVLIVTVGTVQALVRVPGVFAAPEPLVAAKALWLSFAVWILLALEFALAADIIRSAVSPTWDEIGKLAAIAGIRTALNWFLAKDMAEFGPGAETRKPLRERWERKREGAD